MIQCNIPLPLQNKNEFKCNFKDRKIPFSMVCLLSSLNLWTQLSSGATRRKNHSAVNIDNKMIVFGGYDYNWDVVNDNWSYDFSTDTWTQLNSEVTPCVRYGHSAVNIDNKMIVFGGYNEDDNYLNDTWSYDPSTATWTQLSSGPIKEGHVAVNIDDKMIIFGGMYESVSSETWSYDPSTDTWTQLSSGPMALYTASAVNIDNKMIVFGGYNYDAGGYFNNTYSYDPSTDTWIQLSSTSGPSARYGHSAVNIDNKMIVFGGYNYDDGKYLNDIYSYDSLVDTWTQLFPDISPIGRYGHSAVNIDNKMIIFGGYNYDDGGGDLNDTWSYEP